jgi:hypothetical protein
MKSLAILTILLIAASQANASFNATELSDVVTVCMPKALSFF